MSATGKFCVSITHGPSDTDKASMGFHLAATAAASQQQTLVFLSCDAVNLVVRGGADDIHEPGFAPMTELISSFVEAGGTIYACKTCTDKRGYAQDDLIEEATIVGGVKLVEFLADGTPCVSF
ncbi:DsrE family protein [Corynebacterium uterequi]|uniref:Putative peroxiredoxin n=1 Tax=Corynebacterium uterequi TaxID=1072256 RepID=A0A0G3HBN7_9CORY|nr:DsrE family protein [Corynebacterium uterequi]AKK10674.1 putative peroxiredoxin [Corynebacterium uterequi]